MEEKQSSAETFGWSCVLWWSLPAYIPCHPMSLKRILIECINALLTQTKTIVAFWLSSTSVFLPGLLQNLAM